MTRWTRSTWTDAGQLLLVVDPDRPQPDAAGKPLADWFARLLEQGDMAGATAFLAHSLPRYECVVWAARALLEGGWAARSDPAMVAALRWIDDPDDGQRRAAQAVADSVPRTTPSKLLAQAIFVSGGSLAPEDLPPVQPAPDICAKLAGAAVLLGAQSAAEPRAALRQALEMGVAMVSGAGDKGTEAS
jgi:hypothetical protein